MRLSFCSHKSSCPVSLTSIMRHWAWRTRQGWRTDRLNNHSPCFSYKDYKTVHILHSNAPQVFTWSFSSYLVPILVSVSHQTWGHRRFLHHGVRLAYTLKNEGDGHRLLAPERVPCEWWIPWHSWCLRREDSRSGPTKASFTTRTCRRERSFLILMYKQVPVLILFHHINIHDTSEWEMHNSTVQQLALLQKNTIFILNTYTVFPPSFTNVLNHFPAFLT